MKNKKFKVWVNGTHMVEYDTYVELDINELIENGEYDISELIDSLRIAADTNPHVYKDEIIEKFNTEFDVIESRFLSDNNTFTLYGKTTYEQHIIQKLNKISKNELLQHLEKIICKI
jgi:hypothetical protein